MHLAGARGSPVAWSPPEAFALRDLVHQGLHPCVCIPVASSPVTAGTLPMVGCSAGKRAGTV